MPNKTVTLTSPVVGHEVVRQLEFREPTWDDIVECGGDPYVWTKSTTDGDYVVPTPLTSIVKLYAERLIAKGDTKGDPAILSRLGIADSKAVTRAILDFFLAVDPRVTVGSTTSPSTSSSTASGTPASSDA